jgi:hydroxymethylglutaryl-CoA lyase
METVKVIECPRDAMQGIKEIIPAPVKAAYINQLLRVGFDTIDFGSFVSPKSIPQMADTAEVLKNLDLSESRSNLLAIVANLRGAQDAASFDEITYLGFPFSVSETFQDRNTNSTIKESLERVEEIQNLCIKKKKELVIYISMAFGNPYGDKYSPEIVQKWVKKIAELGVNIIALSDTIGVSDADNIDNLFTTLIPEFPNVEFGAHLHTTPERWEEKIDAAWHAGCRRFDSALKGYGGCPMAEDKLTGNMPTENLLRYLKNNDAELHINEISFSEALQMAGEVFPSFNLNVK